MVSNVLIQKMRKNMNQNKSKFQKSDQKFQNLRKKISNTFVDHDFYEIVDQFPLFAGLHTIGNKLFTYELIKSTLDIPGHIVEFGCWKGSNLVYMAKLLELMAPHSSKKVFDSIILLDCLSQQKSMANLLRNRQEDIAVTRTNS